MTGNDVRTMPVSVLIADDEAIARRRVTRLLRGRDNVEVVAQCAGGTEAVQQILELKPELVLLDIEMPDLDGFEVIAEVGLDRMPHVVFVTAFDQHAIRAFEVNAVDYLIKPFTTARFNEAFDRALSRLSQVADRAEEARLTTMMQRLVVEGLPARGPAAEQAGADRIIVKDRDRMRLVRAHEVDWVESEGNYVRLHIGATSYLLRGNLSRLEESLGPFGFVRVHRRFLVNLDRITEVQPWFGGDALLVLTNGAKVRLSRTFREPFEGRFLSL